jgi:hypothetical protein
MTSQSIRGFGDSADLPPGEESRVSTVTSNPSQSRVCAVTNPAAPDPMMPIDFAMDIEPRLSGARSGCCHGRHHLI